MRSSPITWALLLPLLPPGPTPFHHFCRGAPRGRFTRTPVGGPNNLSKHRRLSALKVPTPAAGPCSSPLIPRTGRRRPFRDPPDPAGPWRDGTGGRTACDLRRHLPAAYPKPSGHYLFRLSRCREKDQPTIDPGQRLPGSRCRPGHGCPSPPLLHYHRPMDERPPRTIGLFPPPPGLDSSGAYTWRAP